MTHDNGMMDARVCTRAQLPKAHNNSAIDCRTRFWSLVAAVFAFAKETTQAVIFISKLFY